jgi:hypothetical protein
MAIAKQTLDDQLLRLGSAHLEVERAEFCMSNIHFF